MKSGLQRISEHIWILPFNTLKDRPNLGYILGDEKALAVDAGHSSSHVKCFYDAIRSKSLPLPQLTVITQMHCEHTFSMHAVNGETLARPETSEKLAEIQAEMDADPDKAARFLNSDPTIHREYAEGVPLKVVPADKIVTENREIDLGGVTVELIKSESPHTEDALLVFVPGDRVLFVGDAHLGEYPSWRMDWDKLAALTDKVRSLDADVVIDGHWKPYTKEQFLAEIG